MRRARLARAGGRGCDSIEEVVAGLELQTQEAVRMVHSYSLDRTARIASYKEQTTHVLEHLRLVLFRDLRKNNE
jgi:hypothetical protein